MALDRSPNELTREMVYSWLQTKPDWQEMESYIREKMVGEQFDPDTLLHVAGNERALIDSILGDIGSYV